MYVVALPVAVKLNVEPEQTGLLELKEEDVTATTVTLMVLIDKHETPAVVNVYTPELVTDGITGFCCVELKPPGPVHVYEVAPLVAVKLKVDPEHIGLFDPRVGDAAEPKETFTVPVPEHPKELVTVTEYTPAEAEDTFVTVGDCKVEEKPAGPDHA